MVDWNNLGETTICSREGNGNPLQYSCLEKPLDRGAWWAILHGIARVGHDLVTKPAPPQFTTHATTARLESDLTFGTWE